MPSPADLLPFAAAGLVAGLALLWRGLAGHRTAARIGGTATSRIATLAAGEVRIAGTIEPAEVTLVSALQSTPAVYYRSRVSGRLGGDADELLDEERAVGFVVTDGSGSIRVFPRGATFDVPWRYAEHDDWAGSTPPGLSPRTGPGYAAARPDRDAQVAALLTVRERGDADDLAALLGGDAFGTGRLGGWGGLTLDGESGGRNRRRRYEEARLEPGDTVTILGRAVPFGTLDDPAHADLAEVTHLGAHVEADIAADIAEARAAGLLAPDAETAWGNAAIPGFGIGRPARAPDLHPGADVPSLASADEAAAAERTFSIPPEALVLVASSEVPLLVAAGVPGTATERQQSRFLLGLLGAALAIGSAVVLALGLGATLG